MYKGVAPTTHYALPVNDPSTNGFAGSQAQSTTRDFVVRHISAHSWPSHWVSVSMSFAVAADYATSGGKVYEIDLGKVGPSDILDPIQLLASASSVSGGRFTHEHDGHQDLIVGIGDPSSSNILTTAPLRKAAPPARALPAPKVSDELRAMIFAIRDAELLITNVPSRAVGFVYNIP